MRVGSDAGASAGDQGAWAAAAVDDDVAELGSLLQARPPLLNESLSASGRPALLLAAAWDASRAVAFLLERGADVDAADADGNTALHLAAAANAHRSLALLVAHVLARRRLERQRRAAAPLRPPAPSPANPAPREAVASAVDRRNRDGWTPLLLGALAGAGECCALLLAPGGADAGLRLPSAPFATAADLALRGRHHAVAAALLAADRCV